MALQTVATKVGQPISREQLNKLFELCSQALQYAISIMLESMTSEALLFVESLRELLKQQMTICNKP